jgi:hypothetical protein
MVVAVLRLVGEGQMRKERVRPGQLGAKQYELGYAQDTEKA